MTEMFHIKTTITETIRIFLCVLLVWKVWEENFTTWKCLKLEQDQLECYFHWLSFATDHVKLKDSWAKTLSNGGKSMYLNWKKRNILGFHIYETKGGGSNINMGLPKFWWIGHCLDSCKFVCHSQEILLQINQLHI